MTAKADLLSYKDYVGSAEISHEDHKLIGKILHIDDLVMYEGDTYDDLLESFKSAVDDYLDFCTRVGKQPNKAYSGGFNVRIGPDMHRDAAMTATQEGMSLNDYVRRAIQQSLMSKKAQTQRTPHVLSQKMLGSSADITTATVTKSPASANLRLIADFNKRAA